MKLQNGNRYLIIIKQNKHLPVIKLAYWFEERKTKYHTYETGFYYSKHFYFPYKDVVGYYKKFPSYKTWKLKEPVHNEKYLVFRVGSRYYKKHIPHYAIRKYHEDRLFKNADVKYWIKLSDIDANLIEYI